MALFTIPFAKSSTTSPSTVDYPINILSHQTTTNSKTTGTHANTLRGPLICDTCQHDREIDRDDRLEQLRFGVCDACNRHFREQFPPSAMMCYCPCIAIGDPNVLLASRILRRRTWCREHDHAYYISRIKTLLRRFGFDGLWFGKLTNGRRILLRR